jgi:hypothetical protein
VIEEVA